MLSYSEPCRQLWHSFATLISIDRSRQLREASSRPAVANTSRRPRRARGSELKCRDPNGCTCATRVPCWGHAMQSCDARSAQCVRKPRHRCHITQRRGFDFTRNRSAIQPPSAASTVEVDVVSCPPSRSACVHQGRSCCAQPKLAFLCPNRLRSAQSPCSGGVSP